MEIDPSTFFDNSGDTFIQSGSNNVSNGKVVMADKQFMIEVLGILKEISTLLTKVTERLDKK